MFRKALLLLVLAAGCGGAMETKSTPASPSGGSTATFPASVDEARTDVQKEERNVELASSDCQQACKALASLERAADRLCMVAEPQECSDARVRVDRAKRAVNAQCGGC